jgi:hypothetical protein
LPISAFAPSISTRSAAKAAVEPTLLRTAPIDDQLHRDRLHAAGGEPAADLRPEERGDFVAHQAIENPARLLRVDAVHVDRMGRLDRLNCRGFGDLVELDALGIFELQKLGEMPCDRLTFAVRVGREEHVGGGFRRVPEVFDDVAFPFNSEIARRETVLDVDPERAFGQVAYVPDRRLDVVSRQILLDGARLRR